MEKSKIYKVCAFALIFSLVTPFVSSYAEEFETLQIEIKYPGGDRIDTFQTKYIVYQDSEKIPFMEKNLESNPESISLPKDHKYKIEVYVNGMFASVGFVELNESTNLDLSIPSSGGLKFNAFYERGEKPMDDAIIIVKSQDGEQQRTGTTNENGDTMRYWLQSTSREQDYYVAEVYFDEFLLTSVSNIKIQTSIQQDQKIVVPIPAKVEDLITFRLFDVESNQILKNQGNYSILLTGKNDNSFENQITANNGEIYFSSIPSGIYSASVLKESVKDPLWIDTRVLVIGEPNNFDLIQRDPLQPLPTPFVEPIISSDVEDFETLEMEIRTINGDRIDTFQTKYIVYQDSEKIPFMEKNLESNPESISLPKDHKYKIEVYVNGMYADVGYVQLNESKKLNIIIPPSGGLQLNVFFEGGERPIENVIYVIKSNDGKEQARGNTNENGDTLRHWLQSTSNEDNHYVVEILYDEFLLTSISNVKIHPNILQDQKIIVPIPAITEELITFRLFDSELNKIVNSNEKYSILLTDPQNNQYTKAFISKNGEIFFSSLPSNVYSASVVKDGIKDPLWSDTQIAVAGRQDNFDLIQKNIPELIVVPFSGLVSPPVPDQISKPVIYYEKPFKLSCNCVAIQLNDVQDFWLNDVQIKLLNTFSDNQFPVTIGVIAKTIGDDTKLLDIIKNGLKNNRFEIANSSWDNTPITTHDKKGQDGIIKKSSNKIWEVFGVDSKVFIPPQNEFNENTISVLQANGYTHLSSSLANDPPPYSLRGESFYRFPANAFNAGFDPIDGLKGNTGEEIFSDVQEGINTHGFAVINMHPQEFAVDVDDVLVNELNLEQFKELETLIQKIKNKNIDVVLIGKINQNVSKIISETSNDSLNQNIFPKWVKNTAGWWRDGNIDNKSFVQAIQFLIKENIIQTSQTSQGSGNSEIPEWIKQNSGWWAEGVISDNEFINGLDFLINQGIINIG